MNGHSESSVFTLAGEAPLEADASWPMREDLFSTESGVDPRGESEHSPAETLESGQESSHESSFENGQESGYESGFESPYESNLENGQESGYESPYESNLENGQESGYEAGSENSPESALESRLGSTLEASAFEGADHEYGIPEQSSFEDFPAVAEYPFPTVVLENPPKSDFTGESGFESPFEWALETSAEEAPNQRPVPRHVVNFVNAYRSHAVASQATTAVPALVILGQAALESAWGKKAPGFNFFGIKARASDPPSARQLITTREVMDGPNARFPQVISVTKRADGRYTYIVKDWFQRYPSASEGFAAHGWFLRRNKRYAKAFQHTNDPYAFARAVAASGYATDPGYAAALTSVMRLIERVGAGTPAPSGGPPPVAPPTRPAPTILPSPMPSPGGVPAAVQSLPIPALPAPASPCLTGSDAPLDRALRTPNPGTNRFEGITEIANFAASLARIHAHRLGTDPAKREADLAIDYSATMKAGIARYGTGWRKSMQRKIAQRRNELVRARRGPLTAQDRIALEAIRCGQESWWLSQLNTLRRGWMVGRREQLDFQTLMPKVKPLGTFLPPPLPPGGTDRFISMEPLGTGTPITVVTKDFLAELRRISGPSFEASNYAGHGGGGFKNRGYSLDLFLKGALDDRGFYPQQKAVAFLNQVAAAARAVGLRWRVLYNDFGVAAEVNRRTGSRNVVFVGESGNGLNWHGPLILHFHLDLAP